MQLRFLLLIVILLFLVGCNNDSDEEFYTFKTNSQIVLTEIDEDYSFVNIDTGDNLVFTYRFVKDDDPDAIDDEYSERIIFEIAKDLTSFSFTNEDIGESKMYFNQFCFCPSIGSIRIVNGTLQGERINSSKWLITLNVEFELHGNLVERQIDGVFKLD